MVKEVGAFEAKTHLSKLLDEVEKGERIYITRHGRRIAELSPLQRGKKARFGCAKGKGFYMAPDFDEPIEDCNCLTTSGRIYRIFWMRTALP